MQDECIEYIASEVMCLGVISTLILTAPEHAWLVRLSDEDIFQSAPFAADQPNTENGLALLRKWSASYSEDGVAALRSDRLRLFEGPGMPLAPLWESVYMGNEGKMVFQKETLAVRSWYRSFGLQVRELHHDPDDNIAYEFDFIRHLAEEAADALVRDDRGGYRQLINAQRDFLREHLLQWGFQWCKLMQEHSETDFYRGIALLTAGVLEELSSLNEKPELSSMC